MKVTEKTTIVNMSLATSKKVKGEDKTEWHRVVAFGKTAELCGEYLKKGSKALFEGELQTRSWEDQTGAKKYTTEVIANNVRFMGGKPEAKETVRDYADDVAAPPVVDNSDIPF